MHQEGCTISAIKLIAFLFMMKINTLRITLPILKKKKKKMKVLNEEKWI